jgi:hypothetical protein
LVESKLSKRKIVKFIARRGATANRNSNVYCQRNFAQA